MSSRPIARPNAEANLFLITSTSHYTHVIISRYLMDALASPWALNALSRLALSFLQRNFRMSWFVPLCAIGLVYFWSFFQVAAVVNSALKCCIIGRMLAALLDTMFVVCGVKKRHVWVPLAWWVTFTRVSSGREAPRSVWCSAKHRLLCSTMPWLMRLGALSILSTNWHLPSFDVASISGFARDGHTALPRSISTEGMDQLRQDSWHHQECTSFTGSPVSCDDLRRARKFNSEMMPRMSDASYRAIRKAMDEYGLPGHLWHVGHACPDPSKRSRRDKEDIGRNLFAQHVVDNGKLGHCLVSCAERTYVNAYHVRCTKHEYCVQACD